MAVSTYSTGTVAIAANATSVVGTGSNWSGQNAMSGDLLVVDGNTVIVQDVTDATHLVIDAWPFAAVTSGTAYKIYKVSPLRFVGAQAMAAVDQMVGALNTNGFYVFVPPDASVPDPSLGDDDQYAFQATTGKLWQKTGGTWNFVGTFKGFGVPAAWNSSTAYLPFDVVTLAGTSYVCILANTNQTPPNATYWTVLASKGDTGATGSTGPAAWSVPAAWVTGHAYVAGPPASVVTQGGESYVCLVAHTSGTFATDLAASKWIKVTQKGTDGTGVGTVTSVTVGGTTVTSSGTLPAVAYDASQSLTTTQAGQARANIAAPLKGHLFGCTLSTAGSSATFGVAAGEAADSTGVDLLALASAYTKTTSAWAVGTAAGALDTGTIAAGTWYHVYLIRRLDTGVVDVLVSLSATAPTLPTNYTLFRRIGSMKTDGSSHWVGFTQIDDSFIWASAVLDLSNAVSPTSRTAQAVTVPTGVVVTALFRAAYNTSASGALIYTALIEADITPAVAVAGDMFANTTGVFSGCNVQRITNTSAQIGVRDSVGNRHSISTYGWLDTRGRLM